MPSHPKTHLDDISSLLHVPEQFRQHLSACFELARAFLNKNPELKNDFDRSYGELFARYRTVFYFILEHNREDSKKFLDSVLGDLNGVLNPTNDLRISLNLMQLAFEQMDLKLEHFFKALLVRYRIDLGHLQKKVDLLQDKPQMGMTFAVAAIHEIAPQSLICKDFFQTWEKFKGYLALAQKSFQSDFKGSFCERLEIFRLAARHYELAKYYGRQLRLPTDLEVVDENFSSSLDPDNAIERLNRAYYSLRGQDIYQDFFTKASSDALLGFGDAKNFYNRIVSEMKKGKHLPSTLQVVECGIGDGKFAADFLDQLALMDLEAAASHTSGPEPILIYPRVVYTLCDWSEKMLHHARENQHLMKHHEKLRFELLDANQSAPNPAGGIFYGRFHELFDDIPRTLVLYVDSKGKIFEMFHALRLRKDAIIRDSDYAQGDVQKFKSQLQQPGVEDFSQYHPDGLESVEVICKLKPLDLKKIPYADELLQMVGEHRDMIFPFNVGAGQFFENILKNLANEWGSVGVFDYGYKDLNPIVHQSYYFSNQINRRFGGSLTNDVSYPLLGLLGKKHGFKVRINLQEKWISEMTGEAMVDSTPFLPHYSRRSLIRHVSVKDGIFSSKYLRHFQNIKKSSQKNTNRKAFENFIENTCKKGFLGKLAKMDFLQPARTHLENLEINLDFWINGIYRMQAGGSEIHWLPIKTSYIDNLLFEEGFDSKRVFDDLYANPYYGAFWVLTVR